MPDFSSGDSIATGGTLPASAGLAAAHPKRRALKIEPDLTGDDAAAQLTAALERIAEGLSGIHELLVTLDGRAEELQRAALGRRPRK